MGFLIIKLLVCIDSIKSNSNAFTIMKSFDCAFQLHLTSWSSNCQCLRMIFRKQNKAHLSEFRKVALNPSTLIWGLSAYMLHTDTGLHEIACYQVLEKRANKMYVLIQCFHGYCIHCCIEGIPLVRTVPEKHRFSLNYSRVVMILCRPEQILRVQDFWLSLLRNKVT